MFLAFCLIIYNLTTVASYLKVGAPPEVVARLAAAQHDFEARQRSSFSSKEASKDPELDQFMVGDFFHLSFTILGFCFANGKIDLLEFEIYKYGG